VRTTWRVDSFGGRLDRALRCTFPGPVEDTHRASGMRRRTLLATPDKPDKPDKGNPS
jgi:hypothetical protein